MPIRVEVTLRKAVTDTQGNKTAHKIQNELGLSVDQVRIIRVYTVDGLTEAQVARAIEAGALHDLSCTRPRPRRWPRISTGSSKSASAPA